MKWPPEFRRPFVQLRGLEDDPARKLESARAAVACETAKRTRGRSVDDGYGLGLCHRERHVVEHVEAVSPEDELDSFLADRKAALQRCIDVVAARLAQVAGAARRCADLGDRVPAYALSVFRVEACIAQAGTGDSTADWEDVQGRERAGVKIVLLAEVGVGDPGTTIVAVDAGRAEIAAWRQIRHASALSGCVAAGTGHEQRLARAIGVYAGQLPSAGNVADRPVVAANMATAEGQLAVAEDVEVLRDVVDGDRAIHAVVAGHRRSARGSCRRYRVVRPDRAVVPKVLGIGVVDGEVDALVLAHLQSELEGVVGEVPDVV